MKTTPVKDFSNYDVCHDYVLEAFRFFVGDPISQFTTEENAIVDSVTEQLHGGIIDADEVHETIEMLLELK